VSEVAGFLARWSRLKQQRGTAAIEPATEEPAEIGAGPAAAEVALDVVLPTLESLGAESDYTPFLRLGVPETLRCEALRKAWSSDPAISGFRGFADYDWDCNAPGYGRLLACDDVERLCRAVLGEPPPEQREQPPAGTGSADPAASPELVAEAGSPEEAPPAAEVPAAAADEALG
jgi:hypothetical protein